MSRLALLVGAIAVALALASFLRNSESWPATGEALETGNETGFTMQKMPPGTEFVMVYLRLVNVGDESIVIESVEPISGSDPAGVIDVVRFALAPPDDSEGVTQGSYPMFPPLEATSYSDDDPGCRYQDVVPVSGYEIRAGGENDPLLVTWLRVTRPDRALIELGRVRYSIDGETFVQDLLYTVEVRGKRGARPYLPTENERLCATDDTIILNEAS